MADSGRSSRWFGLIAVAGATLVAVTGAELGLALLGVWPQLIAPYLLENAGVKRPHRDFVVIDPALLERTSYQTPPGARTILALGDSFTTGIPVGSDRSYPVQLENLLNKPNSPTHVINAGHGDSGPDQHHRLLKTVILPQLQPSIVIWQFYFNDIGDNATYPAYAIDAKGALQPLDARWNWLYWRETLYHAIPLPVRWKRRSRLLRIAARASEYWRGREAPVAAAAAIDQWSGDKIAAEIQSFHTLSVEHGFRPYIALVIPEACYRAQPETSAGKGNWPWVNRWNGQLAQLLQGEPGFIELYFPEDDPNRLFAVDQEPVDNIGFRHFGEHGYTRVAEKIAERILADDIAAARAEGATQ